MKQPAPPVRLEAPPGETQREATQRRKRYYLARRMYDLLMSVRCAQCDMTRSNVVHNTEVEDQLEGPDYYADFEQHDFVEPTWSGQ